MEHDGIMTVMLYVYTSKVGEEAKGRSVTVAKIPCTFAGSVDAYKNFTANNEAWGHLTNASWQSIPEWVSCYA